MTDDGARDRSVELRLASAALAAHARGWAVVPLHTGRDGECSCRRARCPAVAKHPRVRWERFRSVGPATTQLRNWWRRWPDANIGVMTGSVSGVSVLDVDPRNGGDEVLRTLEARHGGLPVTIEAVTGGGGRHLWFAAPGEPLASHPVAAGLDLKSEGGLVVMPPSVHATGRRYEWVRGRSPDDTVLAALPAWIADLARGELRHPPGDPGARHGRRLQRTEAEQQDFADAWRRAGIELRDGDTYYLCPFHPDHHPSLHVDAPGCRWYCFGCGRGGGIGALRHELGEAPPAATRTRIRGRRGRRLRRVSLDGTAVVPVVGELAHQDELLAITGGRRSYGGAEVPVVASLVPDREDIGVVVEGRAVGRLAVPEARRYRRLVDDARRVAGDATCRAVVRGGWDRGHGDVGRFGVTLELPDPEEPA